MRIVNMVLGRRNLDDELVRISDEYDRRLEHPRAPTVEVEHEDGTRSLRRATPEEADYAYRVIEKLQSGSDDPTPIRKAFSSEPLQPYRWPDSGGIESVYSAPREDPGPPFWMPASGSCCKGCPGIRDRRCCARTPNRSQS